MLSKLRKLIQLNKLINLILAFPFILLALIPICFELAYWEKIYPGVTIAQIPMGNKSKREVRAILTTTTGQKRPTQLTFIWDSQSWQINLDELKFTHQPEKTIKKAFDLGRNQDLVQNWQTRYELWRHSQNLGLDYILDQAALEEKIATVSAAVFVPAIPPAIDISPGLPGQRATISVNPGKEGQQIEQENLLATINLQLANLIDLPIKLPIKKTTITISQSAIEKTKQRAESLLGKKLILQTTKDSWELSDQEIISWLAFDQGYQQEKIKDYISQLATLINQSPQDALFRFESGRVVAFKPSKSGSLLNQEESVQLIKEGLTQLEKPDENEKSIDLPLQLIEPEIEIGDINRFGIIQKIGEGHSTFTGSITSRIHNIQLSSSRLSGILVPPGGIFSFNQSLGEVSQTTGFQQAYIIKEGRTILGDGGGVCQVSTTLFRAVLRAGLPILERHPHAYRVSYYEQSYQPGFDATVFAPGIDLKFKNDTPAYILVQATINTQTKTLAFELYGTDDGRIVSISKARIWDQVPPPPDLYQDDPNLPAGTIKQIDWKAWGAKVAFDWKVTRNSEVLQERTFYSAYRPWQAVYLRGTGP